MHIYSVIRFVLHCMWMCVCVYAFACVCACLFMLRGDAYISCWAERNRWTNIEWRRTGLEAFSCLCAHERVRGNNKSLLYVLFWSTFGVRFVVSGGHNSDGLMAELLSQDAQHTNHCLPHRVTLHQTNPGTAPTTEKESNQCPHPNFWALLWYKYSKSIHHL